MHDVHTGRGAPSGVLSTRNVYENAGFHEPKTEWSSAAVLEVTYIDNIQVVIDRNDKGTVSLTLWQIGDDSPFDRFDSDVPERYFVVRNMDTKQPLIWALEQLIDEINRDRSSDWSDFTPFNWRQGWDEFVEGKGYQLITLEPCSRRDAEREQARQLCPFYPDHPKIAEPINDGEPSHLFTFLEIYELKSFANGFAKAADHYLEVHKFAGDDWIGYILPSGEVADVQFSLTEDNNRLEAFAYQTRLDEQDRRVTDTADCVRLI
ncbi:MAG: hypothetical protein ABL984_03155 [Pyrinomonadaceae bacterium]